MNRTVVRLVPVCDGVVEEDKLRSLTEESVIVLDPPEKRPVKVDPVHKSIVVPSYQEFDPVQMAQNSHCVLWSSHHEVPEEVDLIGRETR